MSRTRRAGIAVALVAVAATQVASTTDERAAAAERPTVTHRVVLTPEGYRTDVTEVRNPDGSGSGTTSVHLTAAQVRAAERGADGPAPSYADIEHYLRHWRAGDGGPRAGEGSDGAAGRSGAPRVAAQGPGDWLPSRPLCVESSWSDDDVFGYVCATFARRRILPNGDMVFGTKVLGSAYADDERCFDCDQLKSYRSQTWWERDGVVFVWSPTRTADDVSRCYTTSTSVEYKGVSSEQDRTICPEQYGPYEVSSDSNGAAWKTDHGTGDFEYRDVAYQHLGQTRRSLRGVTLTHRVSWD